MNKSVLLTGSQGFIGSYMCNELLNNGYDVVGIDNYSKYGNIKRNHDDHKNFTLIEHDVKDIKSVKDIKDREFDCIIAGAAMIGGISYFHKYAYDLLATNECILAATFDYAIDLYKKELLKKILVLSSSMVFENASTYPTPESDIDKIPPPSSTYGWQKLSSEYFAKGANEQYGLPYIIIRPFNCVGIGENEVPDSNSDSLMSHVVPDLIYKALKTGKNGILEILGSGKQIRHYTSGEDLARGIRIAIESDRAINDDFNISSDRSMSVNELVKIIWKRIYGTENVKIKYVDPYLYDVQIRSPDISKAKDILGFECNKKLEDTIDEVIEWTKNQYNI